MTLHDAAFFEQGAHVADKTFWKQRLKWRLLYHTLSKKADMFHTVSAFSADRLRTSSPQSSRASAWCTMRFHRVSSRR